MPQRRLGDTPIPPRSGFSGGPSASADVQFSRTLGTPLDGCPDPYFEDCPDEEVEELDLEEILREYIRLCLLSEVATPPAPTPSCDPAVSQCHDMELKTNISGQNYSGGKPGSTVTTLRGTPFGKFEIEEEDIIDEDELEREDEVEEVNAISPGGGAMTSKGSISGVQGPLGKGTGQSYKDLVVRNAQFFGGAKLVDPDAPNKIVKRAKKYAKGTAGKKKKRARRSKKK